MQMGPFSAEAENVTRWIAGVGSCVGLLAVLLILSYLKRHPADRDTRAVHWMLLAAFFVLPSVTMLCGNVVGFHRTRQSCADCHSMDPWVEDMKNPASTSLAAEHYKHRWINENQCYTRHAGYGLAGNLEAKASGVSHVIHTYFTGVPEEIRIRKPFAQETCLHCHAETAGYNKIPDHVSP